MYTQNYTKRILQFGWQDLAASEMLLVGATVVVNRLPRILAYPGGENARAHCRLC
ncbi:hypothetical protein OH77DRAFT_1428782 [Trametes cingulata]|nr:hypothetical protein OH77DRAFT_1428782 [Trametes cingulata]